jgi:hypothetical protein
LLNVYSFCLPASSRKAQKLKYKKIIYIYIYIFLWFNMSVKLGFSHDRKKNDWGFSRKGADEEIRTETGEHSRRLQNVRIIRSIIIFIPRHILEWWLNKGWDRWNIFHAWNRSEIMQPFCWKTEGMNRLVEYDLCLTVHHQCRKCNIAKPTRCNK